MRSFTDAYPLNSGRLAAAPAFPDYVENVRLAAGKQLNVPLPAGARFVLFSFTGDVRVRLGAADTNVDDAATANGTGSELNPSARRIPDRSAGGSPAPTHVCLRSAASVDGSLSFYG